MVNNCEGDQKKLFSIIHSLSGSKKITVLPEYTTSFTGMTLVAERPQDKYGRAIFIRYDLN